EFGALVEGNLVPSGSITPTTETLASTGHSSYLLLLISLLVVTTGGVGLWLAGSSK
ncbi:MAG: hypothetical protein QG675_626, partial [Patescibacteria group bacterium]|nr:hypothetical protein [Patescibacteria group bacterium]